MTLKCSGKYRAVLLAVLVVTLSSCARITYFPSGNTETGVASWYGEEFHGKLTSNKEIYDMYAMTAAHQTLPFQTYVRVTNLENGKSAIVRINDRGPFVEGRIIDLSYSAAQTLDLVDLGVAPVRIAVLRHLSPPKDSQQFSVLVGSFVIQENAIFLKKKLGKKYRKVVISPYDLSGQTYYRVKLKARNLKEAEKIAGKLRKANFPSIILEEYASQ